MRKIFGNNKAIVFELLLAAAIAVVMFFALMNIGTYINGTIGSELQDASDSTDVDNTLANVSEGFDSSIDIMLIAVIITVITIPLAAVIAIKRLI